MSLIFPGSAFSIAGGNVSIDKLFERLARIRQFRRRECYGLFRAADDTAACRTCVTGLQRVRLACRRPARTSRLRVFVGAFQEASPGKATTKKSRDAAGIRLSTHFFDYALTLHEDRHGVKDYFPNYIRDKAE